MGQFRREHAPLMMGAALDIADLLGDRRRRQVESPGHRCRSRSFRYPVALKNPYAQIVALDWAAVLEVAKRNAAGMGVSGRYSTIAGSAFDADYGTGYDIALITNFLHHFDRATCVGFLKRVHAALKPAGRSITWSSFPMKTA
jgi:hypothetical protein